MPHRRGGAALAILALCLAGATGCHRSPAPPTTEHLSHGRFHDVVLTAAAAADGAAPPVAVILLLSGDGGWGADPATLAAQFAAHGALVIGIDLPQFRDALNADGASCVYPDGDLDNLSRFVQAYRHLPGYLPPFVAGLGTGAHLARGVLDQSPRGMFAGGLGFSASGGDTRLTKPLCAAPASTAGAPPAAPAPWIVAGADWGAAFDRLVAATAPALPAPPPASLQDLPLVEVPADRGSPAGDSFAIMLSGDGGWAGLDKDVAAALARAGIPVVGLDSLRYFWTARTPAGIAADLGRVIGHYSVAWHRPRVLLVGYSQGADVLPFAVNRLGDAARAHVALTAVMGLSPHAQFEFHVGNWLSDDNSGPGTLPEMNRIGGMPVLCIYGAEETDSLCPALDPHRFTVIRTPGGHHFDGDYAALARQILAAVRSPAP
jgi:type IV secretory pathway VirJ component